VTAESSSTDFISVGGDSVSALQLVSKIEKVFGVKIPLVSLLKSRLSLGMMEAGGEEERRGGKRRERKEEEGRGERRREEGRGRGGKREEEGRGGKRREEEGLGEGGRVGKRREEGDLPATGDLEKIVTYQKLTGRPVDSKFFKTGNFPFYRKITFSV
jgi:hypothetical protein